jgi:hypothetical protein
MERISRVKCQDIGVAEFVFRKIKNSLVARISDLTLLNVVYRTTVDIVRMVLPPSANTNAAGSIMTIKAMITATIVSF